MILQFVGMIALEAFWALNAVNQLKIAFFVNICMICKSGRLLAISLLAKSQIRF